MKLREREPGVIGVFIGFCLVIAIWVPGSVTADSQGLSLTLTPRQVVEQWHHVYPDKIERAAEMTTKSYREGMSKEKWIATQKPFLQNLGMKYVRAKVVYEEILESEARVIVQAHITTVMGDHPQDELYELVRGPHGDWLINRIEVYTETFNSVP
jgi:hypothetical protein